MTLQEKNNYRLAFEALTQRAAHISSLQKLFFDGVTTSESESNEDRLIVGESIKYLLEETENAAAYFREKVYNNK